MIQLNTKSIRFRLTFWYAGFLAVTLMFIGIGALFSLHWYLYTSNWEILSQRGQAVGRTLVSEIPTKGESYFREQLEFRLLPRNFSRFFRLIRADGRVIYVSPMPDDGSFTPATVPKINPKELVDGKNRRFEQIPSGLLCIYTNRVETPDGTAYFLENGVSDRPIRSTLRWTFLAYLLSSVLFLVFGSLGGSILVRNALRPVHLMTVGARRITASNLGRRLIVPRNDDEIERLGMALNEMISRLEATFLQVTRFTGEASHELRTPLTVLKGELEALRESPNLLAGEQDIIASAIEETDRLTQIVTGLLAIARFDAGEAKLEFVPLDLGELASNTGEQVRLLAEDAGLSLDFDVESGVRIFGDKSRLKQVLVNLLDNAIRYTREGGSIRVSVGREGRIPVLEVSDTGIGIPESALPFVFDRFFRVQHVRNEQDNGTGLGLSIVKAICTAHQANLSVKSREGVGTTFRIEFPEKIRKSEMTVVGLPENAGTLSPALPEREVA
jgi:heavy metal sensor kinase